MKIIRINRFTGAEEIIDNIHIGMIFTDEQYRDLISGIPLYTCGFVYQLDTENKESDTETKIWNYNVVTNDYYIQQLEDTIGRQWHGKLTKYIGN